jgi:predicted transcriptional regulator
MRYNRVMKATTIPPLRVSPELRREVEALLEEGETLSSFMLEALKKSVAQRKDQQAFIARGLASAAKGKRTGRYVSADAVLGKLERRLAAARSRGRNA